MSAEEAASMTHSELERALEKKVGDSLMYTISNIYGLQTEPFIQKATLRKGKCPIVKPDPIYVVAL